MDDVNELGRDFLEGIMVKKTKILPPKMKFTLQMEILLLPPDQMESGEI